MLSPHKILSVREQQPTLNSARGKQVDIRRHGSIRRHRRGQREGRTIRPPRYLPAQHRLIFLHRRRIRQRGAVWPYRSSLTRHIRCRENKALAVRPPAQCEIVAEHLRRELRKQLRCRTYIQIMHLNTAQPRAAVCRDHLRRQLLAILGNIPSRLHIWPALLCRTPRLTTRFQHLLTRRPRLSNRTAINHKGTMLLKWMYDYLIKKLLSTVTHGEQQRQAGLRTEQGGHTQRAQGNHLRQRPRRQIVAVETDGVARFAGRAVIPGQQVRRIFPEGILPVIAQGSLRVSGSIRLSI